MQERREPLTESDQSLAVPVPMGMEAAEPQVVAPEIVDSESVPPAESWDEAKPELEAEEPAPLVITDEPEPTHKKSPGFFGKNKSLIAVVLLASLGGGIIGGGLVSVFANDGNRLQIPNGVAPIQITGENVSPVVAIAETVGPAVVGISNIAVGQNWFGRQVSGEQGSGSGVIFRADGYIVTNYHVVAGANTLMVSLADGRDLEAKVIGTDETTDLAVIKIEADDLTVAAFGDSDALKVGELVVAIGNPLGSDFARTVTDGIVSGKDRTVKIEEQSFQLLQTNAAINSGNSGGALVNSQGEVIGINSIKVQQTGVEGIGFAIPINEARPIIEQLMNQGYISRPYMGIAGGSVTEELAKQYQLPVSHGVFIGEITAAGPAEKAGLKLGDIIYKVDGEILKDMDQLTTTLATHQAGDIIKLLVDRNGKPLDINLTLGEQKRDQQQQQQEQQAQQQQQNVQQFIIPFGN